MKFARFVFVVYILLISVVWASTVIVDVCEATGSLTCAANCSTQVTAEDECFSTNLINGWKFECKTFPRCLYAAQWMEPNCNRAIKNHSGTLPCFFCNGPRYQTCSSDSVTLYDNCSDNCSRCEPLLHASMGQCTNKHFSPQNVTVSFELLSFVPCVAIHLLQYEKRDCRGQVNDLGWFPNGGCGQYGVSSHFEYQMAAKCEGKL